jgi:hypothetical protein
MMAQCRIAESLNVPIDSGERFRESSGQQGLAP